MGQTDLETHELDKFLGWMTQVLDQNWVSISSILIFISQRIFRPSFQIVMLSRLTSKYFYYADFELF